MKHFEIKNVQIIKGMAENIPLQNSSINLITSNNGLNNVDDFERAISECSRIAKPGAQFVQTLNLDDSLFEFYGQFKEILSYMRMYQEIELMQQHIYQKRKPLDELIPVMQKRGFVIRDLEYDQFNFRFADGSAFLNHAFIRMAFVDSWLAILPEGKQEIIFDAIESRLNNIANSLGGLKLSIPFALINATKD
jgi:SAM-dependent methyltransferase